MKFMVGDIVTRKSYQHDILFKIIEIDQNNVFLKGIDVRLIADSSIDDLVKVVEEIDYYKEDRQLLQRAKDHLNLDRSEYFYLPGKILHIEADNFLSNHNKILIK